MNAEETPKIIYFQLGNITLKELNNYFVANWDAILSYLKNASFIIAKRKQIKVII